MRFYSLMKYPFGKVSLLWLGLILVATSRLTGAGVQENLSVDTFEYHHLQLTLEIPQGETVINGVASWQVSPFSPGLSDIRFVTQRTDIKAVLVNEQPAPFYLRSDTLLIELQQPFEQHLRFKVEIMYQSDPKFGLFRQDSSLVWSSLNPESSKALLPGLTNARVKIPTDVRIIVPNDWQAVSNGRLLANILLPENKRIYHWRTELPVSVDDISIIAGKLDSEQNEAGISGNSRITLHYFGSDLEQEERSRILQILGDVVSAAEKVIDMPLPFGSLNLVYLQDHLWDTRSAVSAYGYIYANGQDITAQIIRNVSHQYFGASKGGYTNQTDELTLALQAVLSGKIARELNVDVNLTPPSDYPDWNSGIWNVWSPVTWSHAVELEHRTHHRRGLYTRNQAEVFELLRAQIRSVYRLPADSYNWYDILRLYGDEEQVVWPQLSLPDDELTEHYRLIYELDEENSRFQIELIPDEIYQSRNLQLQLRMFVDGSITDRELLISNQGDRIQLSPHGWVENMYLVDIDENTIFTEVKPASFWLYQLRRDSDPARRIESAQGFGRVRDDPDVQLILQDLVRNEPDEIVRAHLVESLSSIVGGAFGTHQRFVELLRDPSQQVRNAALIALSNYTGSEAVQRELYRIISQSQDIAFVNLALGVYKQVVDQQEFYSVARGLLHEDQDDLLFTETIIPLIVGTDQGKGFAPNLLQYTAGNFPISMRIIVFDALQNVDMDMEYWQEVLPGLLIDPDPRIRYQSLSYIGRLPEAQRITLLTDRISNEFDQRILDKAQRLLNVN
jgi:hypothetical protein